MSRPDKPVWHVGRSMNPLNRKVMVVESGAGIPDRLVSAYDMDGDPFSAAVPDSLAASKKLAKGGLGSLLSGLLVPTVLTFCALSATSAVAQASDEVRKFAALTPAARIKAWHDRPSKEFRDVLIADGVDSVPALVNLVH